MMTTILPPPETMASLAPLQGKLEHPHQGTVGKY